jgi:hypothetical protein
MNRTLRIANYGMGTNSSAMLIEATRREIILDLIVESDTGDEFKRSYDYSRMLEEWLVARGQPNFTRTRWEREKPVPGLEQYGTFVPISVLALHRKELPSKAYGLSGCTSKWKQQPIDKEIRRNPSVLAAWTRGDIVERWVGYDAGEPERSDRMLAKNPQPPPHKGIQFRWHWRTPLVEWGMDRDACIKTIMAAGLALPGKSACFDCPSTTKAELDRMAEEEPDWRTGNGYLARAIQIEDAARGSGNLSMVKGLGRRFAWRDYLEGKETYGDAPDMECGCFDGEAA